MAILHLFTAAALSLALCHSPAEGMQACVLVTGQLKCHQDPAKAAFAEVRLYDADGLFWPIPSFLDPDDFMEATFSEHNGSFIITGCGQDPDWFLIPNKPDPYLQIRHYCGSVEGLVFDLDEFDTYVPHQHNAGIIELDTLGSIQPKRKIRPLHPKARVEDEGCMTGHVIQVEPSSKLCRFSNVVRMGHSCEVVPGAERVVALSGWVGNCPSSWTAPDWNSLKSRNSRRSGTMHAHYHRHPVYIKRCVWEVNIKEEDLPTWSEECGQDGPPSNFMIRN